MTELNPASQLSVDPPVPNRIAIDGPAASGKSTVAEMLANHLQYLYFDTGIMYRAITWAALETLGSVGQEGDVTSLAHRVVIDVLPPTRSDGRKEDVLVNGIDVSHHLRKKVVEEHVSQVSSYAGVRDAMTIQQRRIGARGRVVMVGRDIGTVVLPDAELKLYLDASVEERARRRYCEKIGRGEVCTYIEILEAMRKRDQYDSSRPVAPLKMAEDAHRLVSDGFTAVEIFQQVMDLIAAAA